MTNPHLLLIDDDARLTRMVGDYLRTQGFDVDTAGTLADGRMRLAAGSYDALVLDLMLPDGDGLDFTRELRGQPATRRLPLMMLTARGEPTDRIVGLELGADDYLPKPFEPRELLLRLRALLRRIGPAPAARAPIQLGPLTFDPERGELRGPEGITHLTGGEAGLLAALARRPNETLSREELAGTLGTEEAGERAIDVHVTRLRRKIEPDPREPRYLQTIRNRGYMLRPGG
jgi:two-component system phosphate regulon response regulator OmpR